MNKDGKRNTQGGRDSMDKTELAVALTSLPTEQYIDQCLSMVLHYEEVGLIARVIKRIKSEATSEGEGAAE